MRTKSDARRKAIVEIATQLFREVGYERASMASISARVGGSKATLYHYFSSKDELFAAAMIEAIEEQAEEIATILDPTNDDLDQVLLKFGEAYLRLMTAPEALAILRTAVADAAKSQLGPDLYRRGPRRGLEQIAEYLRALQQRGSLVQADSFLMAAHLRGLLEAGQLEPLLFGADIEFKSYLAVKAAVDSFLKIYRN
ncbi:TetR/AcrR family transcriptional regulator [Novosphingobium sp.]|uniref:TetR/AcrR family transcriptional regulator n=1 Tax=Novosphingobium sp. TaxID=1874826 RepID=UPI002FE0FD89